MRQFLGHQKIDDYRIITNVFELANQASFGLIRRGLISINVRGCRGITFVDTELDGGFANATRSIVAVLPNLDERDRLEARSTL